MSAKTGKVRNTIAGVVVSASLLIAAPFIASWEGREYVPYKDVGGVWTVCDGHTGADIVIGKTYTDAECDALFVKDLQQKERAVKRIIPVDMPPETEAAIISFTFNVGEGALERSTLARLANAGDLEGACNQLSRWVFVKGVKIKGLVNRRVSERGLCLEGIGKNPWWGV